MAPPYDAAVTELATPHSEHCASGSWRERFEASPGGRRLLSAFIVFVLGALVVTNLPPSELKRQAFRVVDPFLDVTALHQRWDLFAPDPRRVTLQLEAELTYADGTRVTWRRPVGDRFLGQYRHYRWRKLVSNVADEDQSQLWPDFARWVAEEHRRDGQLPALVELVRVTQLPNGFGERGQPPHPIERTVLYTAYFDESP